VKELAYDITIYFWLTRDKGSFRYLLSTVWTGIYSRGPQRTGEWMPMLMEQSPTAVPYTLTYIPLISSSTTLQVRYFTDHKVQDHKLSKLLGQNLSPK
jgi:hypothetical protein